MLLQHNTGWPARICAAQMIVITVVKVPKRLESARDLISKLSLRLLRTTRLALARSEASVFARDNTLMLCV